ncbi:golgin subfamily A member 5-like [Notolabrus celidotus]|uniref:golgin subfamily A member 5-like n=1 Tax=Notolabrus celidotus TaxID=1203425 RepID=UPI0014903F5B|nr:golgin subfamily A member 5-like [Notolabrus celidotus]
MENKVKVNTMSKASNNSGVQRPTQPGAKVPYQGGEKGREYRHQTPYQKGEGGRPDYRHQTPYQKGEGGRQYLPYHPANNPGYQRPPPRWQVEASLNKRIEELELLLKKERETKKEAVPPKPSIGETSVDEVHGECDKQIKQMREELKHLNPSYRVPQDMFYYSLKTKEELLGVISAQNKKLGQLPAGAEPDNTPRVEKEAPKEKMEVLPSEAESRHLTTTLQMEALEYELRAHVEEKEALKTEMAEMKKKLKLYMWEPTGAPFTLKEDMEVPDEKDISDMAGVTSGEVGKGTNKPSPSFREETSNNSAKMQELQDLVASRNKKLRAERLRADTLQKEQEKSRYMLKQVEAEKLSLEEKVKALQEEVWSIASGETNNANKIQQLQDSVERKNNQLQTERLRADTLQQEKEKLMGKLQEVASQNPKQVKTLKAEKLSLEQKVKALQKEVLSKSSEETINTNKIQQLQVSVERKNNQLQTERLRAEELETEKLSLELKVKALQEEVLNRASGESGNNSDIEELQDLVSKQNKRLQAEMLKADSLQTQLEEKRNQLEEMSNKDRKLIKGLKREQDSLKQELMDLQSETFSREKINREQLEDLQNQLTEKIGSCLELTLKLADRVIQEEVEPIHEEIKALMCEEKAEPSLPLVNIQVTDTPTMIDETSENVQTTPKMVEVTPEIVKARPEMEKISLWRRFKKCMTPHCCRQYKQQRQSQESTESSNNIHKPSGSTDETQIPPKQL